MKKILVIGGGAYQVPLIKRIIESGYEAYCVDGNPNAMGFESATGYKHISVLDENACLEYAKELDINAVMTYGATLTLPTVAYIGEKLGLPALPIDTAELSKSKYKIKKRLADCGCNIKGDFFEMYSVIDAKNHKFTLPCVIKPSDGSGSKGVSLVYNDSEIESAVQYAFNGIRAGVLALIIKALVSMYKKAPKDIFSYILMGASFLLAAFTEINVIFVIIGCGLAGLINSLIIKRRVKE